MKILVTGADGFIGRNLTERLRYKENVELLLCDKQTERERLERYSGECDFVFHLAGVNRPQNEEEFYEGNYGSAQELLSLLREQDNHCPVMLASSIQAELENPYGRSKREGEELFRQYERERGGRILIYRFPNVFGKWCRPNYNSVVATFCCQIARGLPIRMDGRETRISLVYIDDVVEELVRAADGRENRGSDGFCHVEPVHTATLGEIADLLISFGQSRENLDIPDTTDGGFCKKLYSTYLSYLPTDRFSYPLRMKQDGRGSFTEILRTRDRGQFSVNVIKPGIEKGNHWHNTKNEKFVVVSGNALISLRRPDSGEIIRYHVSGENLEAVDIPVGYTHAIKNEGERELVAFMWSNECFDPARPDTYPLKVEPGTEEPGTAELGDTEQESLKQGNILPESGVGQ